MSFSLRNLRFENIRGFEDATLDLRQSRIVLVGENNSGKTAALKVLNWLFNEFDPERTVPTDHDWNVLKPARSTGRQARRLTLEVYFSDGRVARSYNPVGIRRVRLRLKVLQTPEPRIFLKLGNPRKSESWRHAPRAIKLLKLLRTTFRFEHIPAFRDSGTPRFNKTLMSAVSNLLLEKAKPTRQGGTTKEYRELVGVVRSLKTIAGDSTNNLWQEIQNNLPNGMLVDAEPDFNIDPEIIVDWMANRVSLHVSTGDHDVDHVKIGEVGSGLQSLFDIAVFLSLNKADQKKLILAIDEPEAFLHPSAQRVIARQLFQADVVHKLIVATHSPFIVEEAKYSNISIAKKHVFFSANLGTNRRNEISTSLLGGLGAEALFAQSVMLVEGEGDRQFFEAIRRRLARFDASGSCDKLFVLPVGGKERFGPWLKFLTGIRDGEGRTPITWLCVCDGDAATAIKRAFSDSNIDPPHSVAANLQAVANEFAAKNIDAWHAKIRATNQESEKRNFRLRIMPGDLEHGALKSVKLLTLYDLCSKIGLEPNSTKDVAIKLGSKAYTGESKKNAVKAPWMRAILGREIPPGQLSEEVKDIMLAWISPILGIEKAKQLLAKDY